MGVVKQTILIRYVMALVVCVCLVTVTTARQLMSMECRVVMVNHTNLIVAVAVAAAVAVAVAEAEVMAVAVTVFFTCLREVVVLQLQVLEKTSWTNDQVALAVEIVNEVAKTKTWPKK